MKQALRNFSGTLLLRNLIRIIGIVSLLLLTAMPAFSKGAGIEWDTLNQEVLSLIQKGQYARAEVVAKKALDVAVKNVGKNHPDVATSLNNLAELYKAQGQYAQAEPLYKHSLAIYEKAKGSNHPDVALSLKNMADIYRKTGREKQADALESRAAAIRAIKR